jgi:hypothetical protein
MAALVLLATFFPNIEIMNFLSENKHTSHPQTQRYINYFVFSLLVI